MEQEDDIWVTGMSLCSALSPTLSEGWLALLQGQSGLSIQQPFAELSPLPLGLVGHSPIGLQRLLDGVLPDLLTDAQLGSHQFTQRKWGVVIGSSRGYQAELEYTLQDWYSGQYPTAETWLWQYGQSPATQVASCLGLSGPVIAPRAACATGLWAIAQGVELLRTGHCDIVIAGAADAPITPLTLAGFERMGALDRQGAFPFDQRRAGLALGEGAALLILEPRRCAQQRGAKAYGRILGFGLTNDAYHPNAPAIEGGAAITALQNCLNRSNLSAHTVNYIHAHGTGTRLNDATEATLIRTLFPHRPAVSSTKGATGHTLGASGALGAVFCLMALHQQVLPPSVGLHHPESDLNFVFQAQAASLYTALCLSFGFGGQNAAIAFGRVAHAA